MIPYTDHNGKPATMSVQEFTCVPATHSHRAYAYGTPDEGTSRERTIKGLAPRVPDEVLGPLVGISGLSVSKERIALGMGRHRFGPEADLKRWATYYARRPKIARRSKMMKQVHLWRNGFSKTVKGLYNKEVERPKNNKRPWTYKDVAVLFKLGDPMKAAKKLKRTPGACYQRGVIVGAW